MRLLLLQESPPPKEPSSRFHHEWSQQEIGHLQPRRGLSPEPGHAGTMNLDFSMSTTVRNKFLLFTSQPVYVVLCYSDRYGLRQPQKSRGEGKNPHLVPDSTSLLAFAIRKEAMNSSLLGITELTQRGSSHLNVLEPVSFKV